MVSQCRNALSRHASMNSGSSFFFEISRITSSFKPAGTTSDSMSVTKPYLYGCWTWASILVIVAPEVLSGHKLGSQIDCPIGILMVLSGLSTELVDVSIPLPHQSFVVVRRVDLVNDRRIVHRDAHNIL